MVFCARGVGKKQQTLQTRKMQHSSREHGVWIQNLRCCIVRLLCTFAGWNEESSDEFTDIFQFGGLFFQRNQSVGRSKLFISVLIHETLWFSFAAVPGLQHSCYKLGVCECFETMFEQFCLLFFSVVLIGLI